MEADYVPDLALLASDDAAFGAGRAGGARGAEGADGADDTSDADAAAAAAATALRDEMWSGAMRQLGGEHAELARFPGDPDVIYEHVGELWERQASELSRRIDLLGEPSRDA